MGKSKVVFIDEAQRIDNIGLTMKIAIDRLDNVQLWISGSSSFSWFNEPQTGRKWEYELLPISWEKTKVLDKLVQTIALRISREVNYNKISQFVGVDRNAIERDIPILEQGYVISRLPSFSRTIRNKIKEGRKIYFYDNGIRNAVISAVDDLSLRADVGQLWENFLISERIKLNKYHFTLTKSYFWRTSQEREIDSVERRGLGLSAYEFKSITSQIIVYLRPCP